MLSRKLFLAFAALVFAVPALSQAPEKPAAAPTTQSPDKPQVRVNYLNVCSPSQPEQQILTSVLARLASKPAFSQDMEVARGRTTLNPSDLVVNTGAPEATQQASSASRWVRVRRDFVENAPLTSVQYSLSVSDKNVSETLVFHFRDAKEVLQLSINDSVQANDAGQVARVQTPADRIRVERFGKPSVVLARCPAGDQSAYEPIFHSATEVLNSYRRALNIAGTVPAELSRLGVASPHRTTKPAAAPAKPR